jgi:hypothetical protein
VKNRPEKPAVWRHGIATLELGVARTREGGDCALLVVSIPGRDGTMTCAWPMPGGQMTEDTCRDMVARVTSFLVTAVTASIGVQQDLFRSGPERRGDV